MTDNTIGFGAADDQTSYGFQIQPVYTVSGDQANWIMRDIIPVMGAPAGAGLPKLGPDPTPEGGNEWGISDTIVQLFWAPKSESSVKWGIGPQVSLRTRTTQRVRGPGWGGGLSGVLFCSSGRLAYGGVLGHHWGEDTYSVTTLQPIVFYNRAAASGAYVGYNNSITYNWNAVSGDRWQVPVGLTIGRTRAVGSRGDAIDLSVGAYALAARPDGGADWPIIGRSNSVSPGFCPDPREYRRILLRFLDTARKPIKQLDLPHSLQTRGASRSVQQAFQRDDQQAEEQIDRTV